MDRVRLVVLLRRPLGGALLPQLAPSPPCLGAMGASHRAPVHLARRWDSANGRCPNHGSVLQRTVAAPAGLVARGPRIPLPRALGSRAAPTAWPAELLQRTSVNASFLERIHQRSRRIPLYRGPRLSALPSVYRRGGGRHRFVERGVSPRLPESRPSGVCRALHRHGGFRMAGVQHGSGPRRAGGDGAKQLGVPERHGPPSDRRGSPRRARSRDGVRRLPAILARLERCPHDGVRQVRRLPAATAGWHLADGPLLRLRGLDSTRGALKRPPWTPPPASI